VNKGFTNSEGLTMTESTQITAREALDILGVDSDAWKAEPIRRAYVIVQAWLDKLQVDGPGLSPHTIPYTFSGPNNRAHILARLSDELEAAYHAVTFEHIGRVQSGEFEAIEEEWAQQERDRQTFNDTRREPVQWDDIKHL
jgi:hypothetical protein